MVKMVAELMRLVLLPAANAVAQTGTDALWVVVYSVNTNRSFPPTTAVASDKFNPGLCQVARRAVV